MFQEQHISGENLKCDCENCRIFRILRDVERKNVFVENHEKIAQKLFFAEK